MTGNRSNRSWPRLVYWYGEKDGSPESFSVLEVNKIVSYKEGCRKKFNEIPPKIKEKISKGRELSSSEDQIVKGLELMKKDSELSKEEIKKNKCIFDFDINDHIEDYGKLPNLPEETSNYKKMNDQRLRLERKFLRESLLISEPEKKSRLLDEEIRREVAKEGERKFLRESLLISEPEKKSRLLDEEIRREVAKEGAMLEDAVLETEDDSSTSLADIGNKDDSCGHKKCSNIEKQKRKCGSELEERPRLNDKRIKRELQDDGVILETEEKSPGIIDNSDGGNEDDLHPGSTAHDDVKKRKNHTRIKMEEDQYLDSTTSCV